MNKNQRLYSIPIIALILGFGFTISTVTAGPPITITSALPDQAEQGTSGLAIIINGRGFDPIMDVKFCRSETNEACQGGGVDVQPGSVEFISSKKLKVIVDIELEAVIGNFDIEAESLSIPGRRGRGVERFAVIKVGGGQNENLGSADCTLPNSADGYVVSNDGGGDYQNLVADVQCTVGLPRKGKHKLNNYADGGRQVFVNYHPRTDCGIILDDTSLEIDRVAFEMTEINTQTQGNLFTIQVGIPERIPMYIDIADPRPKEAPQRITWGGHERGTSCGPAPLISCVVSVDGRCVEWIIDASDGQACFGADAGPIKPAASECAFKYYETVKMQQQ